MMDANGEYIDDNGIGKFCSSLGLVDIVTTLNPHLATDPTFLWGPNRIDFALVSTGIAEAAIKLGHHHMLFQIIRESTFTSWQRSCLILTLLTVVICLNKNSS